MAGAQVLVLKNPWVVVQRLDDLKKEIKPLDSIPAFADRNAIYLHNSLIRARMDEVVNTFEKLPLFYQNGVRMKEKEYG